MSEPDDTQCPVPRLRAEVAIAALAGGARVSDPAQRLDVAIDAATARVIPLLDGARGLAEIARLLGPAPLAVVRHAIETLGGMFLLDDERGRARAAAARAAAPPVAPAGLRVLAGDRFDCHGCGFCCSNGQKFGPVTEAERARVLAHDWSSEIAAARPEDLFEVSAASQGQPPTIYLGQREGRCVFLTDGNLCRIHARLGVEAKPLTCRAFPFFAARTPEGTFLATRRECESLERSRRTGTPVAAQLAEIAPVMEANHSLIVTSLVPWRGAVTIPFGLARAIQRAALHALEAPADVGASGLQARILSLRDLIVGVDARLGDRPGEPEIEAAHAFADERAGASLARTPDTIDDARARAGRQALAEIAAELAEHAMKVGLYLRFEASCGPTRRTQQDAFSVALLEVLSLVNPTIPRPLAGVAPFASVARQAIALDLRDDADAAGVFCDALRQDVHGWLLLEGTPLLFGFALAPLRFLLAVAHARRAAGARGAAAVSPDDAYAGVLLATRLLATPVSVSIALRDPARLLAFFGGLRFGDPLRV